MLQSAEDAVESSHSFANDQFDRAHDKVRDLRSTVEPAIDRFATRAQELANRGIHAASDATAKVQKQINHYADATGKYVAEQPVKSVLIAAAAGAALAALVIAARLKKFFTSERIDERRVYARRLHRAERGPATCQGSTPAPSRPSDRAAGGRSRSPPPRSPPVRPPRTRPQP